jgi:hypothetical protein
VCMTGSGRDEKAMLVARDLKIFVIFWRRGLACELSEATVDAFGRASEHVGVSGGWTRGNDARNANARINSGIFRTGEVYDESGLMWVRRRLTELRERRVNRCI